MRECHWVVRRWWLIVNETRLFPLLLPSPWALLSCLCFCLSTLLRWEHFRPSFHLTFYLRWDGQLRSIPAWSTFPPRSPQWLSRWVQNKPLQHKSTHFVFFTKAVCVCVWGFCVCAVKCRAQLHGDVSSEVMAASVWCSLAWSLWDYSHLEWGRHPQIAERERETGRSLLFCLWVLNAIHPCTPIQPFLFPFFVVYILVSTALWSPISMTVG